MYHELMGRTCFPCQAGLAAERAERARIATALEHAMNRMQQAGSYDAHLVAELARTQGDLTAARAAQVSRQPYCLVTRRFTD